MIPTIDYIRKKFDAFNALCFDGSLAPIPIRLSNARTFLGQVSYKRTRGFGGRMRYSDFVLKISTKVERTEEVLEDTILHEMIHYWILSNGMQDDATHGRIFRAKMAEINTKFNRHITVTHKATEAERELDDEKRLHLICVTTFANGQHGITIAARSRLFRLWDFMPHLKIVKSIQWYASTDPYFNRYPRALTPKIYPVPTDELQAHLRDAKPLIREGNTIRITP